MQGTRGKLALALAHGIRLTRSSRAQSCGASPPCQTTSTELVNHLSLAHAAVSTVRYLRTPQSAATLVPWCPGARARPGVHGACTAARSSSSLGRSRTHARQFHWASGGRPRACSCIVDRCSTSGPRQAPSQIPRPPVAQSRAPSSVSLCRSISASTLVERDHVYSTLQTPSRAPSSQPSHCRLPRLTRSQAPTLSRRSQSPNCPNRPIPRPDSPQRTRTHERTHRDPHAALRTCQAPPRLPGAAVDLPPDREACPIPVLPRRGHAVLNMRKRETHPYVSQHNER